MKPSVKLALELLAPLALIVGMAVSWGMMQARVSSVEKALDNLSASQWQLMEMEVNRK